jgi:pyrroloquinoline quinone (PQQ) biosynthesis protein C
VGAAVDAALSKFARKNHLENLTAPSLKAIVGGKNGYSIDKARKFLRFQKRIQEELLKHGVITGNPYTAWFRRGEQSREQIRAFIVQFSVFSNQFLVAQLQKMINADSLEGMRASKEILANEIGVVFKSGRRQGASSANADQDGDPELVSTEGTVDGGKFLFRAAHFEWLMRIADRLGLEFQHLGRRMHGTKATLFFCDELIRLYGSEDYLTSQAASFAVENWAAAGFWDELIEGFNKYNKRSGVNLPLAFFTWHSKLEGQHAQHTQEELEELYFGRDIDEDAFIADGNAMLDGVAAFWNGLEEERTGLAAA